MTRQRQPVGTISDQLAALVRATLTARRGCRWQDWRNGQITACRRGCADFATCPEPRLHLPVCRYGQHDASTRSPTGLPCSPRCQDTRDTLTAYARQPGLFSAVGA